MGCAGGLAVAVVAVVALAVVAVMRRWGGGVVVWWCGVVWCGAVVVCLAREVPPAVHVLVARPEPHTPRPDRRALRGE